MNPERKQKQTGKAIVGPYSGTKRAGWSYQCVHSLRFWIALPFLIHQCPLYQLWSYYFDTIDICLTSRIQESCYISYLYGIWGMGLWPFSSDSLEACQSTWSHRNDESYTLLIRYHLYFNTIRHIITALIESFTNIEVTYKVKMNIVIFDISTWFDTMFALSHKDSISCETS